MAWACLSSISFLACSSGDDTTTTAAGGSSGAGGGGTGGSSATGGGGTGTGGGSSATVASCATFNYASYTPGAARTLKADVQPIFNTACATVGCHANGSNHPYLGMAGNTAPTTADLTAIMTELAKNSLEATTGKYVVAGDPANSWLMLKLDQDPTSCMATLCTNSIQPAPIKCGTRMPQTMPTTGLMPAAGITTIRDWIKQGANVQ